MYKAMTATASLTAVALLAASCQPVQVEHKVEPIHVTIDVYHRVDERLDEFFEFEENVPPPPVTQPATAPAAAPVVPPPVVSPLTRPAATRATPTK